MNSQLKKLAVPALRWTLGLVVLFESYRFAFSSPEVHHFAGTKLPRWLPLALGGSEIVAALLFLLPVTTVIGGVLLLVIFALAILLHALHGDFHVEGLSVYGMAVFVCIAHHGRKTMEVARD